MQNGSRALQTVRRLAQIARINRNPHYTPSAKGKAFRLLRNQVGQINAELAGLAESLAALTNDQANPEESYTESTWGQSSTSQSQTDAALLAQEQAATQAAQAALAAETAIVRGITGSAGLGDGFAGAAGGVVINVHVAGTMIAESNLGGRLVGILGQQGFVQNQRNTVG